MDLYERFLTFEVVVNIKNEEEYNLFINRCKECRLKAIKYLARFSFDDLHKDCGIKVIPDGDLCIEFQLGKGFTISKKEEYLNYGCEVISLEDFLKATEL